MNKYILILFLATFLLQADGVFAQTINNIRDDKKQIRKDIQKIQPNLKRKSMMILGQVTAVNGSVLNIVKEGKTYSINTNESTLFRRHFFGKSSLSEIAVGHTIQVFGRFIDEAQITVLARLVRNISVQKRRGAFIGEIISKSSESFVIRSINRDDQTVEVMNSTRYVGRDEKPITFNDLQIGHRVRIKGVWDKVSHKINEVQHVKDYSLPVRTPKGATPSASF